MAYTVEEYVDEIWAYSTRTVDAGTPAASDGSYIDDVGYAIWTYPTRTEDGTADALEALSLDTGSTTLGTPTLTEVAAEALDALSLSMGSTELGTTTLSQLHVLLSSHLSSDAVTLGTPTLSEGSSTVELVAVSLDTGAVAWTGPLMAQDQALLTIDLSSGTPTFTTPTIDAALHVLHRERIMSTQFYDVDRERVTGALRTITSDHSHVHAHEAYEVSFGIQNLADAGTLIVELKTGPSKVIHLKTLEPWTEGTLARFEIIEAPTTSGGVVVAGVNKSRVDAGVYLANAEARTGVTPSGGTTLRSVLFGNNRTPPNDMDHNWVLAPDTKYVLRITNLAGSAKAANLFMVWFEEGSA